MAAQQVFATALYHRNNAHQRNRGGRKPDRKANPNPKQLPSRGQRASFLHGLTHSQRQPVGTDGVASDGIWYRLSPGFKFHIWLMALTSDAKKADFHKLALVKGWLPQASSGKGLASARFSWQGLALTSLLVAKLCFGKGWLEQACFGKGLACTGLLWQGAG